MGCRLGRNHEAGVYRMRTKIGLLAAFAVVTLGVMNLSQAAVPVTDNLPGLPVQGADYWKAVKKEQAAAQAATPAADSREQKADSFFYTGKPYVAELGAYSFQFRNYNPELQRWTSADPFGFPDGANNYTYAHRPNQMFDAFGLQQAVINTTSEVRDHWRTGGGESASAGQYLIQEIKSSSDYASKIVGDVVNTSAQGKLAAVDIYSDSGQIEGVGYRGLDVGMVLGSFELDLGYTSAWTSSQWSWAGTPWESHGERTVTVSNLELLMGFTDRYDFRENPQYNWWQNFWRETIPGYIARSGDPYNISGSFTDSFSLTATQTYE